MEVLKGKELIQQYEEWGKTDKCFQYAARFLRGEVQKEKDYDAMNELNQAVTDSPHSQQEIADFLGMSQSKLSEIINRYKTYINYKYLTQQVRQL